MLSVFLQLTASLLTIGSTLAYGNKHLAGPLLGLVSQIPWWTIMFVDGLWGFLPVNVVMLWMHTRNFLKWRNERTEVEARYGAACAALELRREPFSRRALKGA